MKIPALQMTNHRPVAISTPKGSTTTVAEMMRFIRMVESSANSQRFSKKTKPGAMTQRGKIGYPSRRP